MSSLIVAVGGCGGGGEAAPDASIAVACKAMGGEACFRLPTAPLVTPDGPANIGCGPIVPTASPTAVTFTGKVAQFGTSAPIPNAEVKLFTSPDYTTAIATTVSDSSANYSITLPQGTPDYMWGSVSGAGYLTSYIHSFRPDLSMGDVPDFNLSIFKPANLEGAAVLVDETWDEAYAVAAGFIRDCDRRLVEHAAIVVSSAPGTRAFTSATMYYGAPGAVPLAVPLDERSDTNGNAAYAAFRVPPGQPLYLQAWGFPDAAAMAKGETGLKLIAEERMHVVANSVVAMTMFVNK